MTRPRLRALVLGAGLGERLRPLTATVPKPLLPVRGKPVLEYTLDALLAIGCEATAINLHHLGSQIRDRIGGAYSGMGITYSEEPELLGTLGALGPLREFVSEADAVVVVNGDSLCRWPLKKLVRTHLKANAAATLLLSRRASPSAFGGGVTVHDRRVVALRPRGPVAKGQVRRVFAGAHVFAPELLDRATLALGTQPADFVEHLYEPLLREGEVLRAVTTRRPWFDLGTPARYLEGARNGVARGLRLPLRGSRWLASAARIASSGRVVRSVVESGARVGARARVDRSLLLTDAAIGEGCRVVASVVGPGVDLPPGSKVANRLITVARPEAPQRPQDSRVGGLVYSPLNGTR